MLLTAASDADADVDSEALGADFANAGAGEARTRARGAGAAAAGGGDGAATDATSGIGAAGGAGAMGAAAMGAAGRADGATIPGMNAGGVSNRAGGGAGAAAGAAFALMRRSVGACVCGELAAAGDAGGAGMSVRSRAGESVTLVAAVGRGVRALSPTTSSRSVGGLLCSALALTVSVANPSVFFFAVSTRGASNSKLGRSRTLTSTSEEVNIITAAIERGMR